MTEKEIENGKKLYEALCEAYYSIDGLSGNSLFFALGAFFSNIVREDVSEDDFEKFMGMVCKVTICARKINNKEKDTLKN